MKQKENLEEQLESELAETKNNYLTTKSQLDLTNSENKKLNTQIKEMNDTIKKLNEVINHDDSLGSGFCIGHSYLCELGSDYDLESIVEYDIIPMLREY